MKQKVETLKENRELVWNAIKHFPGLKKIERVNKEGNIKSKGAFYFFVKLPDDVEDIRAVEYLAKEFGIFVIPCSSCGVQNHLRISYGNLSVEECKVASEKLQLGLTSIYSGKFAQWNSNKS